MNEDRIETGAGGTSFVGHDAVHLFRATTLRSAIKMMKTGLRPTRGWTMKKGLTMAGEYTGKSYKRTEVDQALADLTAWIETMKAALPVVQR